MTNDTITTTLKVHCDTSELDAALEKMLRLAAASEQIEARRGIGLELAGAAAAAVTTAAPVSRRRLLGLWWKGRR